MIVKKEISPGEISAVNSLPIAFSMHCNQTQFYWDYQEQQKTSAGKASVYAALQQNIAL